MAAVEPASRSPIMMTEGGIVDENKDTRKAFIRKVYIIFSVQLIFILALVAIFYYVNVLSQFMLIYDWLFYVACARFMIAAFVFLYFERVRRIVPLNYICIFICTESLANVLVYCTDLAQFETLLIGLAAAVVMAIITSLVALGGLFFDLTHRNRWLGFAVIIVMTLMISFFLLKNMVLGFASCAFGIVVISFYLLHCNQLILGKKYRYALKSDEYLAGALFLLVTVISLTICLSLLQWLAQ